MPELPRLVAPLVDRMLADGERLAADVTARPADWTRHLLSRGRQIYVAMRQLREAVPCVQRLEALWDISLLQPDWQQSRVDELASRSLALQLVRPTLLWSDPASAGDEGEAPWHCPHLLLDEDLQPTAGTVLQREARRHSAGCVTRGTFGRRSFQSAVTSSSEAKPVPWGVSTAPGRRRGVSW